MYLVNANTERLEEVEILTVPGLFTTRRVDRATLPPWMHLYEMQTDPDDWSQPGLLGLHITVEHFGTVLTASPLPPAIRRLSGSGSRRLRTGPGCGAVDGG